MTKRSQIWRYFQATDDSAICLLCGKSIGRGNGRGNTTNLISHVRHRHNKEYVKCTLNVLCKKEKVITRKPYHNKLNKWLINNNISINVLDNNDFTDMLKCLNNEVQFPTSTEYLESLLPEIFGNYQNDIRSTILNENVSLMIEKYEFDSTMYICSRVYYLTNDFTPKIICLSVKIVENNEEIQIEKLTKDLMEFYNIKKENILSIVSDDVALMASETVIYLLPIHQIFNLVEECIDEWENGRRILNEFKNHLQMQNLFNNINTRWNRSYLLIEQILQNISTLTTDTNGDEIKVIEKMYQLLKPFYYATKHIENCQNVTSSLCIPLLISLKQFIDECIDIHENDEEIQQFCRNFCEKFNEKLIKLLNCEELWIATYLNNQFGPSYVEKHMQKYLNKNIEKTIDESLNKMSKQQITQDLLSPSLSPTVSVHTETSPIDMVEESIHDIEGTFKSEPLEMDERKDTKWPAWNISDIQNNSSISNNELRQYIQTSVDSKMIYVNDFWKSFPDGQLKQLAKRVFCFGGNIVDDEHVYFKCHQSYIFRHQTVDIDSEEKILTLNLNMK
ncbi:hypothetical protein SNEBB_010686 [Seison nebaliae]|nr:hypothetical protein SNEBB_010686 [Seison nebaliae]